jgi:alkylhydroperoxidase family enzyme
MIQWVLDKMIGSNERRLGAGLDYVRKIAATDLSLLMRYNRLFGFLDPRRKTKAEAYHAARIRGALAADCGTCVQIEINLARQSGLSNDLVDAILAGDTSRLAPATAAVVELADCVVRDRRDNADARAAVITAHGEAGLIELAFAMNGAALLPGIKRAMGYATACNIDTMRRMAKARAE